MNKLITVILIVVALLVGLYGGYMYEKNKWVAMSTQQAADYQKQINDLKAQVAAVPSIAPAAANDVYMTKTDAKLGMYMTDPKGMTLYTFDNDKTGVSNCNGTCATIWPPYVAKDPNAKLPDNMSLVKRSDGSMQYAYKGIPLYYYKNDTQPGDTKGDGFNNLWHIVKLTK